MNKQYIVLLYNLCTISGLIAGDLDLSLSNALQSPIISTWNAISKSTTDIAQALNNVWRSYGKTALTKLAYTLVVATLAASIINKLRHYQKKQLIKLDPEIVEFITQASQLAQQNAHESLPIYIDRLKELYNEYATRYNYVGQQLLQNKWALRQFMDQDHPSVMAEKQRLKHDIAFYSTWQQALKSVIDMVHKKIDEAEKLLLPLL